MAKKFVSRVIVAAVMLQGIVSAGVAKAEEPAKEGPLMPAEFVLFDFESGNYVNRLGGSSGSWNMDPGDINDSWCDEDIIEMQGKDGSVNHVLRLHYSVDSQVPSQNGFWTKLPGLNASNAMAEYEYDDAQGLYTLKTGAVIQKFKYGSDFNTGTADDIQLSLEPYDGEHVEAVKDAQGRMVKVEDKLHGTVSEITYDDTASRYTLTSGALIQALSYGADGTALTADDGLISTEVRKDEGDVIETVKGSFERTAKVINR